MESRAESNFQRGDQEPPPDGREWVSGLSLWQLLNLAARYHLGGLRLSNSDATRLMKSLRKKAEEQLEPGDGIRVETVRVEKRLDGTVAMFFGL